MVVIETREQLEMFAWDIKMNMPDIPENLRLLIIMEPEAFERLVTQISKEWVGDSGGFIYSSQAGIELGIEKG